MHGKIKPYTITENGLMHFLKLQKFHAYAFKEGLGNMHQITPHTVIKFFQ